MNDRNVVLQGKQWNLCTVLEYIFQVLMLSCDLFKELTGVNNRCNCTDFRPIKSFKKGGSRWWVNKLLDRFKFQTDSSIRTNLTLLKEQIIFSCTELNSGPGSSLGIVTDYGLDGPGIESRWG
jgi:hypothetical protein